MEIDVNQKSAGANYEIEWLKNHLVPGSVITLTSAKDITPVGEKQQKYNFTVKKLYPWGITCTRDGIYGDKIREDFTYAEVCTQSHFTKSLVETKPRVWMQ